MLITAVGIAAIALNGVSLVVWIDRWTARRLGQPYGRQRRG